MKGLLAVSVFALLSACSSSDSTSDDVGASNDDQFAFIATRSPDAGQIERYALSDNTLVSTYPGTLNDIVVETDGSHIYQIGRLNLDSLTKFDPTDASQTLFQYSVNGEDLSANPYTIAFVNETKAYLVRYGSTKVWIINPSAATEAEFQIGELDLTAYDTTGEPNANDAVIVGDRLFILMERLDAAFAPTQNGYVAVFDTTTDEEIDTGMGADGLMGISLNTFNPVSLQYLEASDEIYVTGRGNAFVEFNMLEGDPYQGGIETIDPSSFELGLLLDDGTAADNEGFFTSAIIASPTVGYIVTYDDSIASFAERNTLRAFNPTTGVLADDIVADFANTSISDLAVAPDGRLWVGVAGESAGVGSGYYQVDTASNAVVGELLATQLAPINVVFLEIAPAE